MTFKGVWHKGGFLALKNQENGMPVQESRVFLIVFLTKSRINLFIKAVDFHGTVSPAVLTIQWVTHN